MLRAHSKNIADVRLGRRLVMRVLYGRRLVWERAGGPYLRVRPQQLWLTEAVQTADVSVISNTQWTVDGDSSGTSSTLDVAPRIIELPQQGIREALVLHSGRWEIRGIPDETSL